MKLIKYDAARKALAAAVSVDEVKNIRAQAEAMKAYAQMAKDEKMMAHAAMLRLRAERRLGELMDEQAKAVGKDKGGRPKKTGVRKTPVSPASLTEAGIDKNLAKRARVAAKKSEKQFDAEVEAIGEEIITGAARRVRQGSKKQRRAERERQLAAKQTALPDKKYGAIYVDSETPFEVWSEETGSDRAAANHYPVSTWEMIKKRPVWTIAAKDAVLFMWATVPTLPQALEVMTAWGFQYKSHVIWSKNKIGTGYWFRNKHELLLVGTRGDIPAPAPGTQWPSVVEAPVGRHSAKPEVFAEMIESYFPNLPKIELNRRGPARTGWDAWGNEAEDLMAAE
jgi:N6-adenosine-specific RNA methylase IME4